ncbi:MAG: FAD-dependent oxidoreductase, partial [Gammaproteobacteria bacterium]|nr:FAD-dependent oxidoreductase [Gammaproteobacteria bacterium]
MSRSRIILLLVIVGLAGLFFALDLQRFFDLAYLKAQQDRFPVYYAEHRAKTLAAFFGVYIAVTALSLPGAGIMTLAAGALFGLVTGTLVVAFASPIGATLAFLIARYLLRDSVQTRFAHRLEAVNHGIERDGALYLFTLRLVPIFPFFVINLVMGLTPIKTATFFLVSQVGMLPATIVFVNAGTQLAEIESIGDILSPGLIASFALLGVFPLVANRFIDLLKRRKALSGYRRPGQFDRNLVVIGAGSAGLVSAYIAAAVKASVTLVERERMGGDCLNTGCVPSKALLRSARLAHDAHRARALGFQGAAVEPDFRATMQRVQRVINAIEPHDSVERYSALGVDCVAGHARLVSPWEVDIDGRRMTARSIIIATGGRPFVPPIPGIDTIKPLTSDTVWSLESLPERLVVLGGGPIGSELAQAFSRLGSTVTQVEMAPRLLMKEDPEFSTLLRDRFVAEGIDVRLEHKAIAIENDAGGKRVVCENADGDKVRFEFDQLLVAVGRRANTADLGLKELGITLNGDGTVETDDYLRTRVPTVLACGDVAGPYQFTHVAAHQAWYAAVNALFGQLRKF